jgi:hypothetical protein
VSADRVFPKDVLVLYRNSQLLSFAEGASRDPDRVPAGEVYASAPRDVLLYHNREKEVFGRVGPPSRASQRVRAGLHEAFGIVPAAIIGVEMRDGIAGVHVRTWVRPWLPRTHTMDSRSSADYTLCCHVGSFPCQLRLTTILSGAADTAELCHGISLPGAGIHMGGWYRGSGPGRWFSGDRMVCVHVGIPVHYCEHTVWEGADNIP